MADTILLRGGKKADMPTLSTREIVCATDEKALYVGINGVNVRMCGADDRAEIDKKLTANQLELMTELADESELTAVITAYNSLLTALKASGIMKEG